jgi:ferritin-like metal-binding protein YciE
MGLFSSMTLNTLDDLFVVQLEDLYDAEQRLTKALPKMAGASSNGRLKSAFEEHLRQTEQHVARLEKIFQILGITAKRETCEAMKGLIAEGDEAISADGNPDVKDAALIAAAQRVEHYEIAAYGTLVAWARAMGHTDQAELLQETLDEEKATDEKLTSLAEAGINQDAADAAHPEEEEEETVKKPHRGRATSRAAVSARR